jgi:hypothetical protein
MKNRPDLIDQAREEWNLPDNDKPFAVIYGFKTMPVDVVVFEGTMEACVEYVREVVTSAFSEDEIEESARNGFKLEEGSFCTLQQGYQTVSAQFAKGMERKIKPQEKK